MKIWPTVGISFIIEKEIASVMLIVKCRLQYADFEISGFEI
jgi:hypothetical protein